MTNDDRRQHLNRAGVAAIPVVTSSTPPPPPAPPSGGNPYEHIPPDRPTGTPRVDILREAVDLGQQGANALRVWLIGNDIDFVGNTGAWPLRIDWPARTITYWPGGTTEGAVTKPLQRVPLAPLWRILANHGALWCADPAHYSPEGTVCPHRVDASGEHTTYVEDRTLCSDKPRLVPAGRPLSSYPNTEQRPSYDVDAPLELAITTALQRAAPGCEHPDPGQPIYDHTRACAACGAAAVLELFHTAETLELFRRRHTALTKAALTTGHWEAGQGHRYPGHPPGFRPVH